MRIIIPVTCLERGGGIRLLVEVGNRLVGRGHDVHFAVLAGQPIHYAVRGRVSYIPRLLPEYMPPGDVVLPNFYLTVPAALSGRGMPVRLCLGYEPLFVDRVEEAAATYRIPMPVVAISRWLQGVLQERSGRRSVVVNPGVDRGIFHPSAAPRRTDTVLCLARMQSGLSYWFKGLPQFLSAMALVRRSHQAVRIVIASPDLQQYPSSFPVTMVTAPTDGQLADLYRQATVFVFPSLLEGFGLPPLEAMACGTPVVTTSCGGVSDYARGGENCLMVPPDRPEEMAGAILRLLREPELRLRLSRAAVETARPWTWERTAGQMESFLRDVLRGSFTL